jgi:hypothetical protein
MEDGEPMVVHAGPRGGKLYGSLNKHQATTSNSLRSHIEAIFGFDKATYPSKIRPQWYEELAQNPVSYDQCCCCCNNVNWVQTAKYTVQGSDAAKKLVKRLHNKWDGEWVIDAGVPAPSSQAVNPCNMPPPFKDYTFKDDPGAFPGVDFVRAGGNSFKVDFETCAFCASGGPEAFVKDPVFMVTYCCFTWAYKVVNNNNQPGVVRSVGGVQAFPPICLPQSCGKPSDDFKKTIQNKKVYATTTGVVDL